MLTDELIPLCQRKKLGTGKRRIGLLGISMGGYGALLVAEKHPQLIGAAAAISPAIWTSYAQAKAANPGAYAQRGGLRRRRRRHSRQRARARPGPHRLRLRRPLLPGRPDPGPRPAGEPGRRPGPALLRQRLPHRPVLHRPGAPVPRLPGAPPHDGLSGSRRERGPPLAAPRQPWPPSAGRRGQPNPFGRDGVLSRRRRPGPRPSPRPRTPAPPPPRPVRSAGRPRQPRPAPARRRRGVCGRWSGFRCRAR